MQASSFYSKWFGSAVALCALLAASIFGAHAAVASPESALQEVFAGQSGDTERDGLVVTAGEVLDLKIISGGEEHKAEIRQYIRESIWEFNGKDRFFYSSCEEKPNGAPVKGAYNDNGERVAFTSEVESQSRIKVVGILTVMDRKPVIVQHVEVTPVGAAEGAQPLIYEFIVSLKTGTGDTRVVRAHQA